MGPGRGTRGRGADPGGGAGRVLLAALAAALAGGPAAPAAAEGAEEPEQIRVTGSRRAVRSTGEALAPLDVISGSDFSRQGASDTNRMLRTLIPSYNVNEHPIDDGATLVRPANLRGLAPDQTLVLVNGKRRHRAAVISFLGAGVADGAQGPDVGAIPAIALKQVEVLRDGAAAQYGSDAIAGVLNFVLRDEADGGTVATKLGQTYPGDGERRQLSANLGLPLGDGGFLNLSGDWREAEPTVRSVQTDGARKLIAAGRAGIRQPYAQIWGQPDVRDDWKGFLNLAAPLSDDAEFYAFGNYSERQTEGGFFFRNPDDRPGSYRWDAPTGRGDETAKARIVVDLTDDGRDDCPAGASINGPAPVFIAAELTPAQAVHLFPGPGGAAAALERARAAEQAQLRRIEGPGNEHCFIFNERFPDGFTPQFGGELSDRSAVGGVRGELNSGFAYDLSVAKGRNAVDFYIYDTINASFGPDTPTAFELGSYIQEETNVNLDLSYPLELAAFASPLNVAGGFEWREERFEVRAGEPDSWRANDFVAAQGLGVGANGFSGFSPENAGRWDRWNIALYLDLEADVTDRLSMGAALRWEDFSDFGTTANWKLSGLYRLTERLRLRGSYNTGFRAPTVGQQRVTSIITAFGTGAGGQTALVQRATVQPTSALAVPLGGKSLEAEESDAYALGVAADLEPLELTVDFFAIEVSDRIAQSQSFTLDDFVAGSGRCAADATCVWADRAALRAAREASGFGRNADLQRIRFYLNAFDTRTRGIDVVATLPLELRAAGVSELVFAGNWTKTKLIRHAPDAVDRKRIAQLEKGLPRLRFNATLTHDEGDWRALLRANYYGPVRLFHADDENKPHQLGAELTWDLELGYRPAPDLELTLGADNVFDNYPDRNPYAGEHGAKYPEYAPMGTAGGFYYLRGRYEF